LHLSKQTLSHHSNFPRSLKSRDVPMKKRRKSKFHVKKLSHLSWRRKLSKLTK